MTPSGIEPATFRFVAQYLNRCATISGPHINFIRSIIIIRIHTIILPTSVHKYVHIRCMHNELVLIYVYQWPRGLRRGSVAVRLLGLRIRIPPWSWMSVSCECRGLSGRNLCVRLITYPGGILQIVVCLSVIVKPRRLSGLGPLRAVVPWRKNYLCIRKI
jgi:hypothetical protein